MTTKTNLTTTDGLRIYDLDPPAAELTAIAGPEGLDVSTIDPDALPEGCRWVTDDEWQEACERAEWQVTIYPTTRGGQTTEVIRHGSFGPIVWNRETGEFRIPTDHDMDTLDDGDDLTDEEEESIDD